MVVQESKATSQRLDDPLPPCSDKCTQCADVCDIVVSYGLTNLYSSPVFNSSILDTQMLQCLRRFTVQQIYAERSLSCYYHLLLLDGKNVDEWDTICGSGR